MIASCTLRAGAQAKCGSTRSRTPSIRNWSAPFTLEALCGVRLIPLDPTSHSTAALRWSKSVATDGAYSSPTLCTPPGTGSFIPKAFVDGWWGWRLRAKAAFNLTPSCSLNLAVFGRIRCDCRAATPHQISIAIHEIRMAWGRAHAAGRLPWAESSHGMAVCPCAWPAGEKQIRGDSRISADRVRACCRHCRRDSPAAFRPSVRFPACAEVGDCIGLAGPGCLPAVLARAPARRRHAGWVTRPCGVVLSYGIGARGGIDACARASGSSNVGDESPRGGYYARLCCRGEPSHSSVRSICAHGCHADRCRSPSHPLL